MSTAGRDSEALQGGTLPVLSAPAVSDEAPKAGEDREAGEALDAGAFVGALRRRWFLLLSLGLIAAGGAAGAAWYFIPVKHTASTLLHLDATTPAILFNAQDGANFVNFQRTQLTILKSRLVLNAALKQPKVAELRLIRQQADPVQWLEKEVKADYSLAPEVLRVSLSGTSPEELTTIVNAVRDAYLREYVDKEKNERQKRLDKLKKLAADYEELLRDRRRTLRELAENVGSRDAQTAAHRQQFAVERLFMAQKELLQLQSELRKAQVEAVSLPEKEKALEQIEVPPALVEEQVAKDSLVVQLTAEVARLEAAYEAAKASFVKGEQEPKLQKYRTPLDSARAALAARKDAVRPEIVAQLREKARQDLALSVSQLQARIATLKGLEAALAKDIERMEKETQTLNKGSIDLEALREDILQTEDVAKKVAAQIEALKVELQAPSRVKILEDAYVTDADGRKLRMLGTGGAGAAALVLVVALVLGLEVRARRLGSLKELKRDVGIRLVGALPPLPGRRQHGLLKGGLRPGRNALSRQAAEAVDAARTVLLGTAGAEGVRCVMVTSASSGEGKTSLSTQLAASLARVGYRTLLIDGDLRRPAIHKLFNLPPGAGLGELLRGEASLAEATRESPLEGLWLIPAGRADGQSLQALAREKGHDLFATLRRQYDFVVVDSAPVLPVADSLLLGRYVDGVIFSILRDVSRAPAVVAAQERLAMLGIRVLGAVANGMSSDAYEAVYHAAAPAGAEG